MKFSVAPLSTKAFSSAMPLNECRMRGSSILFPDIIYTVCRFSASASLASFAPESHILARFKKASLCVRLVLKGGSDASGGQWHQELLQLLVH
jgi:hypothetical protein